MSSEPIHVTEEAFEKSCNAIIPARDRGFLGAMVQPMQNDRPDPRVAGAGTGRQTDRGKDQHR